MKTTKLLTYFEGAALMAADKFGILAQQPRTLEARKAVFGRGAIKKPEVVQEMNKRFNKEFGEDEAEAIVFALYGETILVSSKL